MKTMMVLAALVWSVAAQAANIAITPLTRSFDKSGGRAAIVTSGSGRWEASTSADWIRLEHTDFSEAGYPVPYTVEANEGVEPRTGYVYVSGNAHTVTQEGIGAQLEASEAQFGSSGGAGSVRVIAPAGKSWHARSNADWLTVDAASGAGTASVGFRVAAFNEISVRSGTLTVAGRIFTVHQRGRDMALTVYEASTDYFAETVKLRVNALADAEWTVEPQVDWIAVASAGSGLGGDAVSLRIAENASWQQRQGTVRIGSETLTVTQFGRTSLVFRLDRGEFAAGAEGGAGERVAVTATQDLGWSASADADWIELYPGYSSGSGNGAIAYKVAANPALRPRSGTITVTAQDDSVAPKRIEVAQAAATAAVSMDGYEFEAGGGAAEVGVATGAIVGWNVVNTNAWLTIAGMPPAGPATLTLSASANTTVYPRSGVVQIAGREFLVSQKGRGVSVDYKAKLFDTDGKTSGSEGENVIAVTADGDVAWIAEADDPTWIIIYSGTSGTGNGTVKYMVAPYVGDGTIRRGVIRIGDKEVTISQRPYAASITPKADWVDGNAGAGEIQVALDVNAVWDVVLTDKSQGWLEVTVLSRDLATGRGRVAIKYKDNNTGKARSAVILIAGEEYTLTQAARQIVEIKTGTEGQGTVAGAGNLNLGSEATLSAVPNAGWVFAGWRKDGFAIEGGPQLALRPVNASATYVAVFEPVSPQLEVKEACLAGVTLAWTDLPWAMQYKVYRSAGTAFADAVCIAECAGGRTEYCDAAGAEGQRYWYWVEAIGAETDVRTVSGETSGTRNKKDFAIRYENLRSATHGNPASYREGTRVEFAAPTARTGYTFAGWSPSVITPATSGEVTVRANWVQNTYRLRFDANGGDAASVEQGCTWGLWGELDSGGGFGDRPGYEFLGWARTSSGAAEFSDGDAVKNLGGVQDGANGETVTLYAVWNPLLAIAGDAGAQVSGDMAQGFTVKPSAGKAEVELVLPAGMDPAKVTVVVDADAALPVAKLQNAKVKIVRGAHDITPYLSLPAADGSGRVNLALATVKEQYAKEPLDTEKGAEVTLDSAAPAIRTAPTRAGLTYKFYEASTLETLFGDAPAEVKIGDGAAWSPAITVKGGDSGFYSIKVEK